ncbi:MAG: hypothetical protein VB120_02630 [Lachnospiraceae bacterium]|nr:hypothetical protein [Lachnospiraceae bacterium]
MIITPDAENNPQRPALANDGAAFPEERPGYFATKAPRNDGWENIAVDDGAAWERIYLMPD